MNKTTMTDIIPFFKNMLGSRWEGKLDGKEEALQQIADYLANSSLAVQIVASVIDMHIADEEIDVLLREYYRQIIQYPKAVTEQDALTIAFKIGTVRAFRNDTKGVCCNLLRGLYFMEMNENDAVVFIGRVCQGVRYLKEEEIIDIVKRSLGLLFVLSLTSLEGAKDYAMDKKLKPICFKQLLTPKEDDDDEDDKHYYKEVVKCMKATATEMKRANFVETRL